MASNTSKKVSIDTQSFGKISVTMDKEDFDKVSKYPLRAKTMGGTSGLCAYVVMGKKWVPLHRFVTGKYLTESRVSSKNGDYLDVRKKNLVIKD